MNLKDKAWFFFFTNGNFEYILGKIIYAFLNLRSLRFFKQSKIGTSGDGAASRLATGAGAQGGAHSACHKRQVGFRWWGRQQRNSQQQTATSSIQTAAAEGRKTEGTTTTCTTATRGDLLNLYLHHNQEYTQDFAWELQKPLCIHRQLKLT